MFFIFHSVARRVFFLSFFKIVNVECERRLHFVTRIDVEMLKKTSPRILKSAIKRHTFKGDLLGSYESPTISTISARNAIKQPWEKNVKYIGKVQWLFVVMFSTYFLPNQMDPTSTM